jgi:peptidyl-prolyl cis-trans isomerase B (cyclophilin B)
MLNKILSFCLLLITFALLGCTDVNAKIASDSLPVNDKQATSLQAATQEKTKELQKCRLEDNKLAQLPQVVAQYAQLRGNATVEIKLKSGSVILEINGDCAPVTAGNFIDLVKKGFYNGLTFHRVVREPQPFVVQGGDPEGSGMGGYLDSQTKKQRFIPLEIMAEGSKNKIPVYSKTLPALQDVVLSHKKGALAMARSQFPDSASSQFYITLSDTVFLDGSYAVFGKVLSGMDLVQKIEMGDRMESVKILTGAEYLKLP